MAYERILIVEDNALNLKLLRDVLQVEGYETVEATTAERGLEIAWGGSAPALILMDVHLPGMDGVAALRALRADARSAATPVVAVTASAMPLERAEIIGAGFDGCFVKPLDIDQILDEVRAVLDRARAERS
ncbi:MAG: response regulator [Deltaproteobacteria bacterium]|nr:response regulator [Deltaproteobacteria bacterium]